MLNHWILLFPTSKANTPPPDEVFLLQENGDRILQENGYGIELDFPTEEDIGIFHTE